MLNFNFIANYRLSVSEAINAQDYIEAVWRLIMFPLVYIAGVGTELLFNSRLLARMTKAINKVLGQDNEVSGKGYVIDESGRLHLGNSIPKYTDVDEGMLGEALERSIHRTSQTGESVCLGDMIEEIKAERR